MSGFIGGGATDTTQTAIEPVTDPLTPLARATPTRSPWGDPARSGRSAHPLPNTPWTQVLAVPLGPPLRPTRLAVHHDRVLVLGHRLWVLFDAAGVPLGSSGLSGVGLALDPRGDGFLAFNTQHNLVGYDLHQGGHRFTVLAAQGAFFDRFVARGSRVVLAGTTPKQPHGPPSTGSNVYAVELGDPLQVGPRGGLDSGARVGSLRTSAQTVLLASNAERVVLATTNMLTLSDLDLQVSGRLSGDFRPLALSLDEEGRMHLVVAVETGRELWVLEPDGSRRLSSPLPGDLPPLRRPPLVSHDHHTYLLAGNQVLAFDQQGAQLWRHHAGAALAGALVTGDDHLLLSRGREVVAFDADGQSHVLFQADSNLITAPVLAPDGDLLVAGAALYRWRPTAP